MTIGLCALTLRPGKYVKSHLIPRALTRPEVPGAKFIESGRGEKPIYRSDSWYDSRLVIAGGEAILARYDTWAIAALRRHKLVWSGWPDGISRLDDLWGELDGASGLSVRSIEGLHGGRLRLFLLSLLWRAAATSRHEFSEISLPPDELEQLRMMVLTGTPEPLDFYPVTLFQHTTRGPAHNYSPVGPAFLRTEQATPKITFRFYMDGLVAHFYRDFSHMAVDAVATESLRVENSRRLLVVGLPFEGSMQEEGLLAAVEEVAGRGFQ